jgi:glucose/arabinose dehydrogenase
MLLLPVLVLALALTGCNAATGDTLEPPTLALKATEIVSGLSNPVHLTTPAGDPRLFIAEQVGRIRIVQNGALLPTPFLDIASKISSGGERGLLSIAFHPRYSTNGFFYVNYTDLQGNTRIERYMVSTTNANVADPASAKLILTFTQPFANHNGGHMLFGTNGFLYIATGDGGSGGDPQNNGQNLNTLLGKILRIDVDRGDPYVVPISNPFVNTNGRPEIWAYGLRNPWRIAIDRVDGNLYIADVGQGTLEEVNFAPLVQPGLNYGWRLMEGTRCFNPTNCDKTGLVQPVLEYDHSDGCSITGGVVSRGGALFALAGHYFYSDYCSGWLRSFKYLGGHLTETRDWGLALGNVTSFGEDASANIYILNAAGKVFRLDLATP